MDYNKIKKLAREQKITLKSLAESVNITEQGFHGYVKKNTMPINILESIADILNVHLVELFDIEKENSEESFQLLKENRLLRIKIEELEDKLEKQKKFLSDDTEPIYKPKLKPKNQIK